MKNTVITTTLLVGALLIGPSIAIAKGETADPKRGALVTDNPDAASGQPVINAGELKSGAKRSIDRLQSDGSDASRAHARSEKNRNKSSRSDGQ